MPIHADGFAAIACGCTSPGLNEIEGPGLHIFVPAMQSREAPAPHVMTVSNEDPAMTAEASGGCTSPTISWNGSIASFDQSGGWATNLASMTYCAERALESSEIKNYHGSQLYDYMTTPLTVQVGAFPNYRGSFNVSASAQVGEFASAGCKPSRTNAGS